MAGPEIKACLAHDDAGDRAAGPDRVDPAGIVLLAGRGISEKSTEQALANFASTPAGVLVLDVQNVVLYLKGKLVGVAIGTPASVGEPVNAAFLIAIEDLVVRSCGISRTPGKVPPWARQLAGEPRI